MTSFSDPKPNAIHVLLAREIMIMYSINRGKNQYFYKLPLTSPTPLQYNQRSENMVHCYFHHHLNLTGVSSLQNILNCYS